MTAPPRNDQDYEVFFRDTDSRVVMHGFHLQGESTGNFSALAAYKRKPGSLPLRQSQKHKTRAVVAVVERERKCHIMQAGMSEDSANEGFNLPFLSAAGSSTSRTEWQTSSEKERLVNYAMVAYCCTAEAFNLTGAGSSFEPTEHLLARLNDAGSASHNRAQARSLLQRIREDYGDVRVDQVELGGMRSKYRAYDKGKNLDTSKVKECLTEAVNVGFSKEKVTGSFGAASKSEAERATSDLYRWAIDTQTYEVRGGDISESDTEKWLKSVRDDCTKWAIIQSTFKPIWLWPGFLDEEVQNRILEAVTPLQVVLAPLYDKEGKSIDPVSVHIPHGATSMRITAGGGGGGGDKGSPASQNFTNGAAGNGGEVVDATFQLGSSSYGQKLEVKLGAGKGSTAGEPTKVSFQGEVLLEAKGGGQKRAQGEQAVRELPAQHGIQVQPGFQVLPGEAGERGNHGEGGARSWSNTPVGGASHWPDDVVRMLHEHSPEIPIEAAARRAITRDVTQHPQIGGGSAGGSHNGGGMPPTVIGAPGACVIQFVL
eukprot:CAMPEP_0178424110 /NCGR_PEP_ID=MMETSP0689_2-20121128/28041_1 /TAXON_ID=160604 /ORGANISM="Amphidinium massartii, Strain CS-259" /LENGTH=540 /DNA_ID=CAMNT_0020045737 /DNA_START=61 /DNA_END=1683 /DNA_ORIENTATION=+